VGPVGDKIGSPHPPLTKVSLTQGSPGPHAAQGGVTLGPGQGELGANFCHLGNLPLRARAINLLIVFGWLRLYRKEIAAHGGRSRMGDKHGKNYQIRVSALHCTEDAGYCRPFQTTNCSRAGNSPASISRGMHPISSIIPWERP
jgi:hypothetical protein